MKRTAKLLAILLTVLLGATALTPLMAHALPPDTGDFTIHKYIMKDLAGAHDPNDGTETTDLPVIGDPKNPQPTDEAYPVEGVVFKLYKLILPSTTSVETDLNTGTNPYPGTDNQNPNNAPWDNTAWADLIQDFNNISFLLSPSYTAPTKILLTDTLTFKGPTGTGDYEVDSFDLGPAITMDETDENGESTIEGLPKGFYLVVEQLNDKVASIVFPFIVAIPMTNADGDGWIDHVHAYPKNGDITITKDVDRNAVKLGEIVNWTVVVSVPADIMHYAEFTMTDILDRGLTYVRGSLVVTGLASENATSGTLIPKDSGEPTPAKVYYEETLGAAAADGSRTLSVAFIKAGVDGRPKLFDWDEGTPNDNLVKFVKFEFQTVVNENILDRSAADPDHLSYTIYNDASINFKNRFDVTTRTRTSRPKVEIHSAAILFLKEDAHTNTALEGAQFQIASSEQNAKDGKFLKRVQRTVDTGVGGAGGTKTIWAVIDFPVRTDFGAPGEPGDTNYSNALSEYNSAADWIETSQIVPAQTGVSPTPAAPYDILKKYSFSDYSLWASKIQNKAFVRFEGLKEFTGKTGSPTYVPSYWVVEVKAPTTASGQSYNLLSEPIKLTFSSSVSNKTGWYTLDGGVVRNTNTFTLPRTGGIGTILFTAGGIALIGVAALLLIAGAKKKKQKASQA